MARTAIRVRRLASGAARLMPLLGAIIIASATAPTPASAQFSWFGQSDTSAQDAYDTIAQHGFRLLGPLMQNRDVFIADVLDRRQRRERLIISRENGQIVQRFLVDTGRASAYATLPGAPNGGPLPPRQAQSGDVFARIVRGFNDDGAPRPPADVGQPDRQDAVEPRTLPKAQRLSRPRPSDVEPHLATRRDEAPVTSRPLTPEPTPVTAPAPTAVAPTTPVAKPAAAAPEEKKPVPAQADVPAAPSSPRATVVSTDPLRIPGSKEPDAAKPTTTAAAKPAAPAKPAPAKPADVPVAPLD